MTALAILVLAFGPFGSENHPVTREARFERTGPADSPSSSFFRLSYELYRLVLSPIDGPRCSHRPTCSRYAMQAVDRHGALGILLAVDRLLRAEQSSALRTLRLLKEGERLYLVDPLEESTFWFTSR